MRRLIVLTLIVVSVFTSFGQAVASNPTMQSADIPQELHLHLNRLVSAQAPHIVANHLVLSGQGAFRSVGVAFSHEDWTLIHRFQKNTNGLFVLALPLPFGPGRSVAYRIVIDGLWTIDPNNRIKTIDNASGLPVSVLELPERSIRVFGSWNPAVNRQDSSALFFYEGQPGQRITVSGSFNGWDPFLHELEEVSPGNYELELTLPPGTYYYTFIYKGERLKDPLNKTVAWDSIGRQVSVLTIRQP